MEKNDKSLGESLVKRFPEFESAWLEHLADWEGEERSIGIDVQAFSIFISGMLEKGEKYRYDEVFIYIEELVTSGNESLETAVVTMFIEGLFNRCSSGSFRKEDFIGYLQPESLRYFTLWEEQS